jgi:hypothetical protein
MAGAFNTLEGRRCELSIGYIIFVTLLPPTGKNQYYAIIDQPEIVFDFQLVRDSIRHVLSKPIQNHYRAIDW